MNTRDIGPVHHIGKGVEAVEGVLINERHGLLSEAIHQPSKAGDKSFVNCLVGAKMSRYQ